MLKNSSSRRALLACTALAAVGLSGCASIVDGNTQSLSVKALSKEDKELADVKCSLTNDKGSWYVTAPGSVSVHRSRKDLTVICQAADAQLGKTIVQSSTKGMAFGNILFGGVIGAGVDISTGAAFDYPQLITVNMGRLVDLGSSSADTASTTAPADESAATPAVAPTVVASAHPLSSVRHYVAYTDSGVEIALRSHANFDGGCRPRPAPVITFVQLPVNGTMTVRQEPVTVTEGVSTQNCDGMTYNGSRIYYKPNDNFHGSEEIAYRLDTGASRSEVHFIVNVH